MCIGNCGSKNEACPSTGILNLFPSKGSLQWHIHNLMRTLADWLRFYLQEAQLRNEDGLRTSKLLQARKDRITLVNVHHNKRMQNHLWSTMQQILVNDLYLTQLITAWTADWVQVVSHKQFSGHSTLWSRKSWWLQPGKKTWLLLVNLRVHLVSSAYQDVVHVHQFYWSCSSKEHEVVFIQNRIPWKCHFLSFPERHRLPI